VPRNGPSRPRNERHQPDQKCDPACFRTDYLEYVRDPANGYVSVAFPVEDGMEISSWTGRLTAEVAASGNLLI
jgi:hypothetical protein